MTFLLPWSEAWFLVACGCSCPGLLFSLLHVQTRALHADRFPEVSEGNNFLLSFEVAVTKCLLVAFWQSDAQPKTCSDRALPFYCYPHLSVSFAHIFSREVVPDICEQLLLCLWGRFFLIGFQLSYRAVVVDLPAGLMGLWTISSNFGEVK